MCGPVQDVAASIVSAAHEGNVRHVLVGGTYVKRDGILTGIDPQDLVEEARTSQRQLLARAR